MEYFRVRQDVRVRHAVGVKLTDRFRKEVADGNAAPCVLLADGDGDLDAISYISLSDILAINDPNLRGACLIEDCLEAVFRRYAPSAFFKTVGVTGPGFMQVYCLFKPKRRATVASVADLSEMRWRDWERYIICLIDGKKSELIVSLEVVESMLRRGCMGVSFEKIC